MCEKQLRYSLILVHAIWKGLGPSRKLLALASSTLFQMHVKRITSIEKHLPKMEYS